VSRVAVRWLARRWDGGLLSSARQVEETFLWSVPLAQPSIKRSAGPLTNAGRNPIYKNVRSGAMFPDSYARLTWAATGRCMFQILVAETSGREPNGADADTFVGSASSLEPAQRFAASKGGLKDSEGRAADGGMEPIRRLSC
jgi:hypothetical protein